MAPPKIFAEPEVSESLTNLLTTPPRLSIAFIIGSSVENKHRLVHIAPVKELTEDDEDEARRKRVTVEECTAGSADCGDESSPRRTPSSNSISDSETNSSPVVPVSLRDVKASLVTEQASQLTRLLPGKFRILGLAVVSKNNILDGTAGKDISKISAILDSIKKAVELDSNPWLLDDGLEMNEWLLAAADFATKRFKYAIGAAPFVENQRACDWKFLTEATKWHEFSARVAVDWKFFVPQEIRDKSLFKQFKICLKPFVTDLRNANCLVDGYARDPSEAVEPLQKDVSKKKSRPAKEPKSSEHIRCHRVEFLMEPGLESEPSGVVKYWDNTAGLLHLRGTIVCRAYSDSKTTVGRSISELKADLLRSLFVRLRMHCDSLLEEDDLTSAVVLHELPRRVLVSLTPFDEEVSNSSGGSTRASPRRGSEYVAPKILISDYLFPGEGAEDACESLSKILGVFVTEDRVMECSESVAFERRTSGLLSETEGSPVPTAESAENPEVSLIQDETQVTQPESVKLAAGKDPFGFKIAAGVGIFSILFAVVLILYSRLSD